MMNEQNKYRLVGAVALIIMALLFIPFFLKDKQSDAGVELAPIPVDQATEKKTSPIPMNVPDHNSVRIQDNERTVLPPPPPADKMKPQPVPDNTKPSLPDNPLAIPVPKQQISSVKKPLVAKPKHPAAKPKSPIVKKAVQHQHRVVEHGWVTQIGLFSNRLNAQRLIDQLHSRGFHASLRQIHKKTLLKKKHRSSLRYQVIIGPVTRHRNEAEKRLTTLNHALQALHIKGFLITI